MNITGTVKIIDFPDEARLTTVKQLLIDLERYLAIELPVERITNVYVSIGEPDVTERDIIWYKTNSAGGFVGQFVYSQGEWTQMFPPPQGVFKMYGNSLNVPAGYALITEQTPGFTLAMYNHLKQYWRAESGGYYSVFDVVYVGL